MSPEITSKVQKLSPGDRKVVLETGIGWKVIFFLRLFATFSRIISIFAE